MHTPDRTRPTTAPATRPHAGRRAQQQAPAAQAPADAQAVLALQRSAGNGATSMMLSAMQQQPAAVQQPAQNPAAGSSQGTGLHLRDHKGHELRSDEHKRITAYLRHLAKKDRPDVYRLLLERLRKANRDQQANELQAQWDSEFTANSAKRVAVPRQIHFIWMGEKPRDTVIKNLQLWRQEVEKTESTEDGQWTMTLWTDSSGSQWGSELAKTFGKHLEIRTNADSMVKSIAGKKNFELYERAKNEKVYEMASDILRYSVLKKYGGVYMDVDIAPGSVRLRNAPHTRLHPDQIPLLAPLIRDKAGTNKVLGRGSQTDLNDRDLLEAARLRYNKKTIYRGNENDDNIRFNLNNNMIVSQPGSKFMQHLLKELPKEFAARNKKSKNIRKRPLDLKEGVADISGPSFVATAIKSFAKKHHGVPSFIEVTKKEVIRLNPEDIQHLFDREALAYWINLQWVTEESENQLETASVNSGAGSSGIIASGNAERKKSTLLGRLVDRIVTNARRLRLRSRGSQA